MIYREYVSLNIAIIGNEKICEHLVASFTYSGHKVFTANKQGIHSGYELPDTGCVYPCSIEDAADLADFIIIATPPQDVREVAYWLGDVRKKVIIDMTANASASGQINTVGAISSITGSLHIVIVLNIYGHEHLFTPLFGGQKPELLFAGDSLKAKVIAEVIAKELGITNCYDFGGSDRYPLFDEVANCCRSIIDGNDKQQKAIQVSH